VSAYAWVIDRDHLAEEYEEPAERSDAGLTGPRRATDEDLARLEAGEGHQFTMWDDDGEHYYTGRIVWAGEDPDEDLMVAPLRDYGRPGAGAVVIKYPGHPDWTCEA
jgi:hypothetical protein